MKKHIKLFSLALAFITCFAVMTGCKDTGGESDTDISNAPYILDGCRIIYGEGGGYGSESASAMELQAQLKARYGLDVEIDTDYLEKGAEYDSESREILVGHTEYPQSKSAAQRVTRQDYLITVDGSKIVLMAGCTYSLEDCVEYFLENYITSEDGTLKLSTREEHLELHSYPYEKTTARIISLNLRYAHSAAQNNQGIREPRVIDFINEAKPDSIGFQECEKFWKTRLDANINELGYVAAQEEAYSASGDYAFKNYIFYNTNTTNLIQGGRIWLSETPNTPSQGYGSKYYISASWAVLEDKDTGAKYIHVNTHLNADNAQIREKEIVVLLAKIKTFVDKGYPVFITGDFNSDLKSDVYKTMTESFVDARKTAKDTSGLYTYNGYSNEGVILDTDTYKCIDFCFYSEEPYICVEKFNVIDRWHGGYMSDHNALITDFTLYKR